MPAKLEDDTARLNVIVPASLMQKLEDWRRHQPGLPNISQAVRTLLEMSLEAAKKGGKHR